MVRPGSRQRVQRVTATSLPPAGTAPVTSQAVVPFTSWDSVKNPPLEGLPSGLAAYAPPENAKYGAGHCALTVWKNPVLATPPETRNVEPSSGAHCTSSWVLSLELTTSPAYSQPRP